MHRYAEGTLGNVEKQLNSLYKSIFLIHRYADGTLEMLKKQVEFPHTNQYFPCIAMPRDPSELLKKHWNS